METAGAGAGFSNIREKGSAQGTWWLKLLEQLLDGV